MRFLDANVVIHALLEPKRQLSRPEIQIKTSARKIIERIEKGEKVVTTVVHLSEIANILGKFDKNYTHKTIKSLLGNPNIFVEPVDRNMYTLALEFSHEPKIDINNGLALLIMAKTGLTEIYSFDSGFDLPNIRRIID